MKPQICAVSYLGPEGYGNDMTGLRNWDTLATDITQPPRLNQLHWSQFFQSDASRFARMDLMSRIGSIAVELLDAGLETLPPAQRDCTGVYLETAVGCAATDVQFLKTPRPSLFTYTLPSTLLGEISIRYHLRGPMLCLVTPGKSQLLFEANDLLARGEAEACVCVSCDAFEVETGISLQPTGLAITEWHSCALLVAKDSIAEGFASRAAHGASVGNLQKLCRQIVSEFKPR